MLHWKDYVQVEILVSTFFNNLIHLNSTPTKTQRSGTGTSPLNGVLLNETRSRHPKLWSWVGFRKHYMNNTSGGDRIQAVLFKIPKDNAVEGLQTRCQQLWKIRQWSQNWKRSVSISIPKKDSNKAWTRLLHCCAHFTCDQGSAQHPSS